MESRIDLVSLNQNKKNIFDLGYMAFLNGKFKKSVPYLRESLKFFLEEKDFDLYLKCCRMLLLALHEQQELGLLKEIRDEFNDTCRKYNLQKDPRFLILDSFYNFYSDKDLKKAYSSFSEALDIALRNKNECMKNKDYFGEIKTKLDLMDCLYSYSVYYLNSGDNTKCRQEIDNLKVLIQDFFNLKESAQIEKSKTNNSQQHQYFDKILHFVETETTYVKRMELHAEFILASIEESYREADRKLWKCYETAAATNNDYFIPYVITQMSYNYYKLGEFEQSFTFLNLAEKNLDKENFRLLAKRVQEIKKYLETKREDIEDSYDIIFDQEARSIFEKQKGCVSCGNQFILINLFKLFLLNPGNTYSKRYLIENIWEQEYTPSEHDNKIYVTIKRLRELIEPDINKPRYIFRNKNGYYLTDQVKVLVKGEVQ